MNNRIINKVPVTIIVGKELERRILTIVPRRLTNRPIMMADKNNRFSSDKLTSPASTGPFSFLNFLSILL